MTRQELMELTNGVYQCAVNDIQEKLLSYIQTTTKSFDEVADLMGVSRNELTKLLFQTDAKISLYTFLQILALTDHAIDVKPLKEVIKQNNRSLDDDEEDDDNADCHDWIGYESVSTTKDAEIPTPQEPKVHIQRDMPINDSTFPKRGNTCKPNFEAMERSELQKIIRNKLWDSEIDLNAPKEALVKFLNDKDGQFRTLQFIESLEKDPKVQNFISELKSISEADPSFKKYIQLI